TKVPIIKIHNSVCTPKIGGHPYFVRRFSSVKLFCILDTDISKMFNSHKSSMVDVMTGDSYSFCDVPLHVLFSH
ncbi:hypothetical protein BB560_003953, partial [Smittium megazygosporum]